MVGTVDKALGDLRLDWGSWYWSVEQEANKQ